MKKLLFLLLCLFLVSQGLLAKMRIYTHVDTASFPTELRQNLRFHQWEKGFLDVTKPPYNAPADGLSDATAAIQLAIDHAYACNLVVFIPHGTYLVSDQLSCYQDPGPQLPNNPVKHLGQRKFGHIIKGSEKNGRWPVIRLQDGSTVKDNTLFVFKYYNAETGEEDASRHYLATLRNLEIDMGENPEVSAVYNNGAQLCALENLRIYGNFHMGISTLPGSGGYTANIEITGGRIGIYQDNFRPNPTLFNIILDGQSECGLKVLDTRGSLTMAGFRIKSPEEPDPSYRAVFLFNEMFPIELGARANLNLVDGSIEMAGSSPAISSYRQDLLIRNVFFNAQIIVESGTWSGNPDVLPGEQGQWKHLQEYVYASGIDGGSVYRNRINLRSGGEDFVIHDEMVDSLPPASLLTMHHWGVLPSWEDSMQVDLVVDYGATRDFEQDNDALAMQQALDDISNPSHPHYGKSLFIPRGHFHLSSPVCIPAGCKIIGAAKNISVLMVSENSFTHENKAVSMLKTADSPGPGIILSDLALVQIHPHPDIAGGAHQLITMLELKTGNSLIRDVQTDYRKIKWKDHQYREPVLKFTGNAGGKIYGLCFDEGTQGIAEKGYRHVKINGAELPLTFYQISVEDAEAEKEGEQTIHMEIDSSTEVTIYGFKYEKESELLHVTSTERLVIIGGSGNYGLKDPDDEAIITIQNTPNVFIGNISRKIQDGEIPGKAFLKDEGLYLPGDAPIVLYSKVNDTLDHETDTFRLDFEVISVGAGQAIPGADIYVAGDTLFTGSDGRSSTRLNAGLYPFSVSAEGYTGYSDTVLLNRDTLIQIHLIGNTLTPSVSKYSILLNPNPATDQLVIQFTGKENIETQLDFYDLNGRIAKSIPINVNSGLNQIYCSISSLDPGIYILRLQYISGTFLKE